MNNYTATNGTTNGTNMKTFLENCNLFKLHQEDIENPNGPMTSKKTESVIKNPPMTTKRGFTGEFYQASEEELMLFHLKLLTKIKEEGHSQTHFARPSLPKYQSQGRTLLGKKTSSQ